MIDTIIIGGGPAGLMVAHTLEKANIEYLLLEKNEKVGKKLLITGNKRCNVTCNRDVEEFINDLTITNKRFLYSALYTFGPNEVLSFFNDLGIEFVLENNLKYFPKSGKAQSILDALLSCINESHIILNQSVREITKSGDYYKVKTKTDEFESKNIVIATGSNSFPNTGSSGDGLEFAKQLDIKHTAFSPAETHTYSKQVKKEFKNLQGLSYKQVTVSIPQTKHKYTHDILFTHLGVSGPVIYHLSEFIDEEVKKGNNRIILNFTKHNKESLHQLISKYNGSIQSFLQTYFTKKHTNEVCRIISKQHTNELSKEEIDSLASYLTEYEIIIDKVEDRERSYVNKGGVDTKELHPHSLEVKKKPNIYFIGETTNLHGPIGGYNITIALSTGYLAALDIIEKRIMK